MTLTAGFCAALVGAWHAQRMNEKNPLLTEVLFLKMMKVHIQRLVAAVNHVVEARAAQPECAPSPERAIRRNRLGRSVALVHRGRYVRMPLWTLLVRCRNEML